MDQAILDDPAKFGLYRRFEMMSGRLLFSHFAFLSEEYDSRETILKRGHIFLLNLSIVYTVTEGSKRRLTDGAKELLMEADTKWTLAVTLLPSSSLFS